MLMARKQAWVTVLVVTVIAIFGGIMVKMANQPKKELVLETASLYPEARALEAFNAVDQNQNTFDQAQLQNKWTLFFFGYTHCPDICPTTLATMTSVQKMLPDNMKDAVQFVFVTVDPERDTPEHLNEYVKFFSDRLIALHLEPAALQAFARDLGVAYAKVDQEGGYVMDHSVRIFLINPRGQRHAIISPTVGTQGFSVERVKNDLLNIITY
jgi:protein SCO1/2